MPIEPLFAALRRGLAPGLADGTKAIRDQQLYRTLAAEPDPGACDRVELESEVAAAAAMAIDRPQKTSDMPMEIERGGRR